MKTPLGWFQPGGFFYLPPPRGADAAKRWKSAASAALVHRKISPHSSKFCTCFFHPALDPGPRACYTQRMDMKTMAVAARDNEKYDNYVKAVFSQPRIIATILRMAVPEFAGMSVEEVLPCIIQISDSEAVDDVSRAALQNLPQEQSALLEKLISYDLHIKARNPKAGEINVSLFLDVEFQNEYRKSTLGYPLLKRAMYYVARELSAQLGQLSESTDYGSLQKSYSIWICNEHIPKSEQNSMTRYRIVKEDVIGKSEDVPEEYDLMEVVIIRRGGAASDAEIFDFLDGLFQSDLERIRKYSGSDRAIEEEVKKMSGFGAALAERKLNEGIAQGITQGIAQGITQGIGIGLADAAKLMNFLWRSGRGEDAERAENDRDYLNQLLAEFKQNTPSA